MVNFSRAHYRISLHRPFARGAYRLEGPTGLGGGGALAPVPPLAKPLYRFTIPTVFKAPIPNYIGTYLQF